MEGIILLLLLFILFLYYREGYSLANLKSAIGFIQSLDVTKVSNITEDEYLFNIKKYKEIVRKEELQITSSNGLFSKIEGNDSDLF